MNKRQIKAAHKRGEVIEWRRRNRGNLAWTEAPQGWPLVWNWEAFDFRLKGEQ